MTISMGQNKAAAFLKTGLLVVLVCFTGEINSYYLFPGAYPFTDCYGNIGCSYSNGYPYGGYGIGEGFPYYPLGYGGYGNHRSYSFNTAVPSGVFGRDGCGCDGYGKYGCNCG
ncbi:uncharacterized protein LOC124366586 isoform X1 [Homalodisca vitripennis]|uniref:uncharacterized protein LOC124366586 isoform X1 n=1 Tax=Homalodisca vitripennis TaxID=197043 RepID=UPI001EEA8F07|nr:uncharacterized protein LOC124366586 isoform X1 [Homalodisca vitripennis]